MKNYIKEKWYHIVIAIMLFPAMLSLKYYYHYIPRQERAEEEKCINQIVTRAKNQGKTITADSIRNMEEVCSMGPRIIDKDKNDLPDCSYEISDLGEFKSSYGKERDYFVIYSGIIKNTSNKEEILESVVARIYNENDLYITEDYSFVEKSMKPNTSIIFEVKINIPVKDSKIGSYYENSKIIKPDIYPWFSTCK